MEDLQAVEHVCRKDPKVIEQCVISGIPAEDMHKVYCDRKSVAETTMGFANSYLQLGQLATITDSVAMFDYNKLLCITDLILTIVNTPTLSISAPSSTLARTKSYTSISPKFADQSTKRNPTTITRLALRQKEATGQISSQSISHNQKAFRSRSMAELLNGKILVCMLDSIIRRVLC